MGFMDKFRASKQNHWFQRLLRIVQFLSAVISLGLFSSRLVKIIRLYHLARAADGAVEGILAAAVLYTLAMMLINFCLKRGAPGPLRWILVLLDILFLGAFIAVAVLTRPQGGPAGPHSCNRSRFTPVIPKGQNCNLPWGTFILAIISTILHALTAAFHEVRDHHKEKMARHHGDHHKEKARHNGDSPLVDNGEKRYAAV
ncbi:hypothetical protein F5Y15DRAFT_390805 [Xylariaceae sp. FL0016]|nr:hypothetical protein F5Y15DRAFT_390805 [Xylariaceae sp. FL0016]